MPTTPTLPSAFHGNIKERILPFCTLDKKIPAFTYINDQGVTTLAHFLNISFKEAMVHCLDNHLWPARFVRNKEFIAPHEQKLLLQSHVAVMGCGGLGGAVLTALARLGIGTITCCDHDSFDETNLNRQAFCTEATINKRKAMVSKQALKNIASYITVHAHHVTLSKENLPKLLGDAHIAVDCLDNFPTRFALEHACKQKNIPFVHGALAGLEGFAMTCTAKDNNISNLYSHVGLKGAEEKTGTPTPTPTIIGQIQSLLALELLLQRPFFVANKQAHNLLHLDLSLPEIIALQLKNTP